MILNIFLTAVIFSIVLTVVIQAFAPHELPDVIASVVFACFILCWGIVVLSAIALVWTR